MTDDERKSYVLSSIAITKKLKRTHLDKKMRLAGYAGYMGSSGTYENRMRSLLNYNRKSYKCFRQMLIVFGLVTLVLSYVFILQPAFEAPPIEYELVFDVGSSYLVAQDDGRFAYYQDDQQISTISAEGIKIPPFSEMPIITNEVK